MKKLITGMLMLGIVSISSAQEDLLFINKLTNEEVPSTLTSAIKKRFNNLEVTEYIAVPKNLSPAVNDNGIEKYDRFVVIFKGKTTLITATYDKNGSLLSTVDHYKKSEPPIVIKKALLETYPDWILVNDYKKMTTYTKTGALKNERFKLTLKKGKKNRKVITNSLGKKIKEKGKI